MHRRRPRARRAAGLLERPVIESTPLRDIAPGPGPVPSGSATTPPPSSMMAPEKAAAKEESSDAADLNRHQWGVKSTSGNYPWDTTPSPLGGRMKKSA